METHTSCLVLTQCCFFLPYSLSDSYHSCWEKKTLISYPPTGIWIRNKLKPRFMKRCKCLTKHHCNLGSKMKAWSSERMQALSVLIADVKPGPYLVYCCTPKNIWWDNRRPDREDALCIQDSSTQNSYHRYIHSKIQSERSQKRQNQQQQQHSASQQAQIYRWGCCRKLGDSNLTLQIVHSSQQFG